MTEEIIKTKKIVIVDDEDNTRMELRTDPKGNPQIILRDNIGNPSILLCVDDKNRPTLILNAADSMIPNVEANGRAASDSCLTLAQEGKDMSLHIGSGIHGNRIILCVGKNNESNLLLIDKDNNLKTAVTSGDQGIGNVIIFNNERSIAALSQLIK